MIAEATKIQITRAKSIAENADANLGSLKRTYRFSNYRSTPLKTFPMVVRSIRNQNKTANITVRLVIR
jgi:hypothetical protein